ncbi:acyltransferase family protein [Kallipyga massiliensis]|uniref:acyltransferase family protein n=1 Tax=Kallipyga massiliensis TaxID=1472764 RepID=UPI0026EBA00C|nr:acyltransferase family protein [Kallipyga massiliensis]
MTKRIQWLDSLRVYAFALVVIYHLGSSFLPAGFFGVNLFFALSGFLITGKFLDAVLKEEKESFWTFLKKRGGRLLPGLVLMFLVTSLFLLVASPDLRVDYFRQFAGASGFMTNWYEIRSGGSYEAQFIPHIYVHTWTLAIEMHFYFLWGGALYLIARRAKSREGRRKSRPAKDQVQVRLSVLVLSLAFFVLPHILMIAGSFLGWSTSFLYFSDFTRMSPFFAGALMACLTGMESVAPPVRKLADDLSKGISWALFLVPLVLMAVLSFNLSYEDPSTYRWGFLMVDLLCFLALGGCRILDLQYDAWKEIPPIHYLAQASYGFYLFHWPIYVALSTTPLPGGLTIFLTLVLASLLAWLNLNLWEPLVLSRKLARVFQKEKRRITNGAFILAILGVILVFVQGMTAPPLLSLDNQLWSSSLNQELDQVVDEGEKVKEMIAQEKLAEQQRKEEEAMLKKARAEGFTMVGDSVTLGMRKEILKAFPKAQVNGKVSRFLHQGPDILRSMAKSGHLKEMVVIGLGNNVYPSFKKSCAEIIDLLPSGSRIIFISPYQRDANKMSDVIKYANYLPELEKEYPFVTIADWNQAARAHPDFFKGTDGVHFYAHKDGIPLYINTLKEAIAKAYKKPAKP